MGVADYIGKEIRTMRKSRKMTQADLAAAIGQSPSSITMYETGQREPSFETLEALADVFNVPLSSILGYEPEIEEPAHFYLKEMMNKHETELTSFAEMYMNMSPEKQKLTMRVVTDIAYEGDDE